MNATGKRARKASGRNRHEIKRATRAKRHAALSDPHYDPKIGTNARMAVNRQAH
jgi:hypothetical protein